MPANKYTKALYRTGTVASEKAAVANRDPARKAAAEKTTAREGTTSAAGGRPAKERNTLREAVLKIAPSKPVKILAIKMPAKQQVIRTTTAMKPTPSTSKRK